MSRASAFSGSAFRTAMGVLLIVGAVLGVAGWLVFTTTRTALDEELRSRIIEDFDLLRDAYAQGAEQGLVAFIQSASATRSDKAYVFGMFTKDGVHLTGNITTAPTLRGWDTIANSTNQRLGEDAYLVYVEELGDHIVLVGGSLRIVTATSRVVLSAILVSGLVIAIASLATGYLLSRGVSSKLEVMSKALEDVSRGNADTRVPVSTANDQIDQVSRQINVHLDRLAELMANMRNTAVAIAHDLKSPLNRVSIFLQEAVLSRDPDHSSELLAKAQDELDSLKSVLDTMLRISRIESSDDRSSFVVFPASPLVEDLAQTFEAVAEAAGQSLRFTATTDDSVAIFGDRRMVRQLLVNLIENASRHGGPGVGIEVGIGVENGGALITVADNGPGIPADKREDVFKPFFRMNAERNSLGTGLGLALVKAVAVRHRAAVQLADNNPGLKVTVAFPPDRQPAA